MNLFFFRLDWRFVRSLGELHILTRASYVMLGLVPILAGIWISVIWSKLHMGDKYLPHSWVFAFLAALAVTLGQVIYQIRAPEIVRRSTLDQYMRDETQHYTLQPTPERLEVADLSLDPENREIVPFQYAYRWYYPISMEIEELQYEITRIVRDNDFLLQRIFDYTRTNRGVIQELKLRDVSDELTERYYSTLGEVSDMTRGVRDYVKRETYYSLEKEQLRNWGDNERMTMAIASHLLQMAVPGIEERGLLHNITKIGYAARLRYLLEADRRKWAMSAASILYFAAVVLIGIITVDQTKAVLTAAGWDCLWNTVACECPRKFW